MEEEGFTETPPLSTSTPTSNSESKKLSSTIGATEHRKFALQNISLTRELNPGLQFLDVPNGDDLRIKNLELEKEYLIFEAFSNLMGYLQPTGFPTEMLRAVLQNEVPLHIMGFQIIKLEIVAVVWVIFWAILSLCVPIGVLANFCCASNIRRLNNDDFSNDSHSTRERWREHSIGCLLHGLLLLMLCPIILMLAGNEQISRSIAKSPMSANVIYEDINTFIRNSHMQISFVATSSTDITIDAIRKDLEEVQLLLGKPYQKELSTETGLEGALLVLEDLKEATKKVTSLVTDLLHECGSARKAGSALQEQLKDISRQLSVARRQCNVKDRGLCYTLQFSSFDVSLALHNLTSDDNILQLERMDYDEKINLSIETARKSFADVPDQIASETAEYVTDIKSLLSKRRTEMYKSIHALDTLTRSLTNRVTVSQNFISSTIQEIADWDLWRWLTILVITAVVSLIWGLLLCGAPCGCGLTSRTVPFLISGVSLSGIIVIVVWALGVASFLLGGYGHSLLCRPLYDQPYRTLSELLDTDGILYGEEGFFKEFSAGNDSVKVADVLKFCQRNHPVYQTFLLHNKFNIEKVFNYKTWDGLSIILSNFSSGKKHLDILNPSLQTKLQLLASISTVNLTTYRMQLSSPVTKGDLGSFADQLNTVARQLTDAIEARKIDNLAFAIRKIIQQEMFRLMEIKNRILYKITTLEVLLPPLSKQANQSLSHLKAIQFFLDNKGWQIAERMKQQYIARIEHHLQDLYNHVQTKVTKDIGKCRPLWDIFYAARFSVCKLVVDPMNGISASCFILILVFLTLVPVVVKLVDNYRENDDRPSASISHRHSIEGLLIDDEGAWATPTSRSPESPITRSSRQAEQPQPLSWISPNAPARLPQIPSISRTISPRSKLSTFASRITGTRNLTHQLPSISRARTPRRGHESLRLIEPIHWKSGSTTPRSWI